jgi:glutaredoxin 3
VASPKVVVYTGPLCPYCVRAKRLLDERGVSFEEVDVASDPDERVKMVEASGRRTIPQIFVDGQPIGGFDELAALDRRDGLAALRADNDDASR